MYKKTKPETRVLTKSPVFTKPTHDYAYNKYIKSTHTLLNDFEVYKLINNGLQMTIKQQLEA